MSGSLMLDEAEAVVDILTGAESMITREKARQLRAVIEDAVEAYALDNASALEVVELFPAWQSGKEYAIGARVQYGGKLYECVNAHTASNEWSPPRRHRFGTR